MDGDEDLDELIERMAADRRGGRSNISVDESICIVLHPRRRAILRYLRDRGEDGVSVDEIIDAVTAVERQYGRSEESRKRLMIDVRSIQLPYLADAGLVEYYPDIERVYYRPNSRVELLLECVAGMDDRF